MGSVFMCVRDIKVRTGFYRTEEGFKALMMLGPLLCGFRNNSITCTASPT